MDRVLMRQDKVLYRISICHNRSSPNLFIQVYSQKQKVMEALCQLSSQTGNRFN